MCCSHTCYTADGNGKKMLYCLEMYKCFTTKSVLSHHPENDLKEQLHTQTLDGSDRQMNWKCLQCRKVWLDMLHFGDILQIFFSALVF